MRKCAVDTTALQYAERAPRVNWSPKKDVEKRLTFVDFSSEIKPDKGGIPIISDGKTAYVDTSDNHCVILSPSGLKKSTCGFMPASLTALFAGDTVIVHDPKGELYSRTAKLAEKEGYRKIVLDFRDFNGDGYNPLAYPAKLWKRGEVDKAVAAANDFCCVVSQRQENQHGNDIYWVDTAKSCYNGILPVMFDSYENTDCINIQSLASYFYSGNIQHLEKFVNNCKASNTAMTNIRAFLSEPEKTRASTLSVASSFIQPFLLNDKLSRMLSHSTFDIEEIAEQKIVVYLITDDTTDVCNAVVGMFFSQLITVLADKAFHTEGGTLQRRVNFFVDETGSVPIPRLSKTIATCRSRNIRFFLCFQSLADLENMYPDYKGILANCATMLFLGSTEKELLDMISERCGTTEMTFSGKTEPLISVAELMTLKKEWYYKEAIYLNLSEGIRYVTTLPAVEKYESFDTSEAEKFPVCVHPEVREYTFVDLMRDVSAGKAKKPFSYQVKGQQKKTGKQAESSPATGVTGSAFRNRLSAEIDDLLEALSSTNIKEDN